MILGLIFSPNRFLSRLSILWLIILCLMFLVLMLFLLILSGLVFLGMILRFLSFPGLML